MRASQVLVSAVLVGACVSSSPAGVTLIGWQYQQDDWFPEFNCIWKDKYYPSSCPVGTAVGCNIHAYLKNTGTSPISVSSVNLQNYNLGIVLKLNESVHDARSIYFYWDNPPQDILDAGEPVWYKVDPSTAIPAGGVAQVVVRLRFVPVINPVNLNIVTTGGAVNAAIAINASAAQLASVGFSQDRRKVYLHWRRSGGAAPTTIMMDGVDVTAQATTVGDPAVNYAASVLSFATPLEPMSYHVYQGVYGDGKTATGALRTWVNKFIHGTFNTFDVESSPNYTIEDWIEESSNHGINNCQVSVGNVVRYMNTAAGAADCQARGYGYTTGDKTKFDTGGLGPDMFFINDEIDAEESNMERTFCGTGLKLPCGKSPMGILAMRSIAEGEELRAIRPLTPTSINMNGSFKPENYYAYGQAVDILQVDPYYQRRLQDAYWRDQNVIPVYEKATYIYAVAKAVARAAEPNPSNVILYSCSWKCTDSTKCDPEYVGQIWPFADPETKRIEAYYALAAGTKGLCYWWLNIGWPSMGLANQSTQAARDLWKEIGLYGNEIKTIAPQLVVSHPVDMALFPGSKVWARALVSGTDTVILLVVNDDYYNDTAGFHSNPVSNASVVATLPSWMRSPAPTAFEVRPSGLFDVATSLSGSNLTVSLGTLQVTKMVVITTNPQLRATVQQRYEQEVWPGVCAFAPEYCLPQNNPPSITAQPSSQAADPGGTAVFTVGAAGTSPLSYQWQKDQADLSNGGHYVGATTATLTISSVDGGDVGSYRCVVTNPYGTATSNGAMLTLNAPGPPSITQQPSSQSVVPGGTAVFTVGAAGTAPLSYQWQKNEADLSSGGHYSGATTATLTVSSADAGDAASYRCVVTNGYGSATSNGATLTVTTCSAPNLENGGFEGTGTGGVAAGWTAYTRPTVPSFIAYTLQAASPAEGLQYQQIQTSYVATGGAGVYQVVSGCTVGATYRIQGWYRTNSASGRATVKCAPNGSTSYASAIDLSPAATTTSSSWVSFSGTVTATASSMTVFLDGQTHVVVTGDGKACAFDGVTVTCVGPAAPTIVAQPGVQSVCAGGTATFTVVATGEGPLSYQWQKDQANLSNGGHYAGVTTASLAVSGADTNDAGSYRCVVSNAGGSVPSNGASLVLKAPTQITQAPVSQEVALGGTAVFTVVATGEGVLSYQWQKNGVGLSEGGHYAGTGTSALTVSSVDGGDNAAYRCVVTGFCGTVVSGEAILTLAPTSYAAGDFDEDGDVDLYDFTVFQLCFNGPNRSASESCVADADFDNDTDVDLADFAWFQGCYNGPNRPAACP